MDRKKFERNIPKCDLQKIGNVGATEEDVFEALVKLLQTPQPNNTTPQGIVWKM